MDYVPLKEEPESEFATTDSGSGDGGTGDDDMGNICPPKEEPEPKLGSGDVDEYYNYVPLKKEPEFEFTTTDSRSGNGDTGDDYMRDIDPLKEEPERKLSIGDVGSHYNYVPLKEEPEFEFAATDNGGGDGGTGDDYASIIGYYDPLQIEPKPEFRDGDRDAVDVDGYYACEPPKAEPEPGFPATGVDAVADGGRNVGHNCCHCGVSLPTGEIKVEHELRCKVHVKQKASESKVTEVYYCSHCRCPFLSKEFKEQHQQEYCRNRFKTRRTFKGPYFKCDKCRYVAMFKEDLARHVVKHNVEWFTCTQCSFKTVHKLGMTRHMEIHNNTFSCCCPICGKKIRVKRALDEHLLKKHFDESDEFSKLITRKTYTCNICDRFRTTIKSRYDKHVTVTHRQKYECPHCPYSTFRKSVLKKHSKTHAEQKDYQCATCKKQFDNNVDLVKTITSKMHRCQSCSFKTVETTHLKSHVRSKHV